MAIIHMDTTGPIRTMATITGLHITGTTGIAITATIIVIIITVTGTKLTDI
jgi:hypothetical protein